MRYEIFVLMLSCNVALHEKSTNQDSGISRRGESPTQVSVMSTANRFTNIAFGSIMSRPKRNARRLSPAHNQKLQQRNALVKAKRLKTKRYLMKQLRKAEKKSALLNSEDNFETKRELIAGKSKSAQDATQESQNELLASVDDLPRRSAAVEISVKDPGLCKVDGVPMCKHGGECMSRDEGGAPVFFCACQPAWGSDFCHEPRDPCSPGLPDCGSMFRCHRDEDNPLAGFTCGCHERIGWTRRSESDPRCIRITRCSDGNPCQNGGTCSQEEGGFVCVCTEFSSGDLCEHPLSADSGSAPPASPAISRITALLTSDPALDGYSAYPQRRAADGGTFPAGYVSALSPDDSGAISPGYSGALTAGYSGYPQRRTADSGSVSAGYNGALLAGYSGVPAAGYGGVPAAGYGGVPAAGYGGAPNGRRRRSHGGASGRTSRRQRRHEAFLERLLRDVEPQIRRTARDSVIELPHRR